MDYAVINLTNPTTQVDTSVDFDGDDTTAYITFGDLTLVCRVDSLFDFLGLLQKQVDVAIAEAGS